MSGLEVKMIMEDKRKTNTLRALSKERRNEDLANDLFFFQDKDRRGYAKHVGDFGEDLDTDEYVTPYTKGSNNLCSDIMLVLHDWSSENELQKLKIGSDKRNEVVEKGRDEGKPTNTRVKNLLSEYLGKELEEIYATNAFPFIKPGPMSNGIYPNQFQYCVRKYTVEEIKIVQPKVVIAATHAYEALYYHYCGEGNVIRDRFELDDGGIVLKVYHPSAPLKKEQWERVRAAYNKLCL